MWPAAAIPLKPWPNPTCDALDSATCRSIMEADSARLRAGLWPMEPGRDPVLLPRLRRLLLAGDIPEPWCWGAGCAPEPDTEGLRWPPEAEGPWWAREPGEVSLCALEEERLGVAPWCRSLW